MPEARAMLAGRALEKILVHLQEEKTTASTSLRTESGAPPADLIATAVTQGRPGRPLA
jgi:hypothetical protein